MRQLSLESLGHDILVNDVFPYLSKQDLDQLKLVSPALENFVNDPTVWHDLFFRTFGMQPNPFTIRNWPEMYRWRSKAGLYTWGENEDGRLGYRSSRPYPALPRFNNGEPEPVIVPTRYNSGVCTPFPVKSLTGMTISDLVTGGYWSAVLSADGEIYAIGELDRHINIPAPPRPNPRNNNDDNANGFLNRFYDPPPVSTIPFGFGGIDFGRHIRGLLPGRFGGGVRNSTQDQLGLVPEPPGPPGGRAGGNAPALFGDHRPRIGVTRNLEPDFDHEPTGSEFQPTAPEPTETASAAETGDSSGRTETEGHEEDADMTADLVTSEDQARNNGLLNNTTNSIVLPNAENFPYLFGQNSELNSINSTSSSSNPEADLDSEFIDYDRCNTFDARMASKCLTVLSNRSIKFMTLGKGSCTHILALDSDNDVWLWDRAFFLPGVKLVFDFNKNRDKVGEDNGDKESKEDAKDKGKVHKKAKVESETKPEKRTILQLQAAWNCSVAHVEGIGLVVWYKPKASEIPYTRSQLEAWKNQEKSIEVTTIAVPHTGAESGSPDYVVDFHAGERFLVYATAEGKIYRINTETASDIRTGARKELIAVEKKLQELAEQSQEAETECEDSNSGGSFSKTKRDFSTDPVKVVRLCGGYQNVAVISDTDNVICFNTREIQESRPLLGPSVTASRASEFTGVVSLTAHPELQNVGCISIAVGDWHYLALLRGGKMLSWGRESLSNGALGLGLGLYDNGRGGDIEVEHPTPVVFEGKALAIAAGGWQSSAIITTDDISA